ncbi:APC family permease [Flavilitoribacter nigricans]|uniref:Amino acid permease n=1 Tax=Flavilitoribacter nigricans (strain ATCC 23147 / DSM 23189 / NBRC 102662 / NCIMB 1420 / SS-2) TaxID=1122177 RepID=A0A2D0MZX8_FLAN2|nr:amino acid permease [Flavilitoribacter nigricans]PHN01449.1 amino acid permease [Flavilitoribacter nigricans DSM 23189 = NBRC 102662]
MSQLQRKITLYGLTMIAVGSCIGAGIFITPYKIVQAVPHQGYVLMVWAIGGLIALTGALTFAELGGLFTKAGGVYVFLKEAYGSLTGFLYGWVILLVVNTGSLAALAITFSEYMTFFVPLGQTGKILLSVAVVGILTLINAVGVNVSQGVASLFTMLKLLAIAAIVLVGWFFYDPARIQLSLDLAKNVPADLSSGLLLALIGVLWSFGGWHHATYLAGETIKPQRTVPRAMLLGALIVTVTYVLVNLAYMMLLPLADIQNSTRVAGDAVGAVINGGGKIVAIAIAISVFGTISIYTMSAPRIYYAMAQDGVFFKELANVHPRFRTPTTAMYIQALWAILLLLFWGTFENLITYVTFMDIAFMALAGASVIVFRRRMPDADRPYRTWGYPVVPAIFILISTAFVINTLIQQPKQAIAGLVVLGLGWIVFTLVRFRRNEAPEE